MSSQLSKNRATYYFCKISASPWWLPQRSLLGTLICTSSFDARVRDVISCAKTLPSACFLGGVLVFFVHVSTTLKGIVLPNKHYAVVAAATPPPPTQFKIRNRSILGCETSFVAQNCYRQLAFQGGFCFFFDVNVYVDNQDVYVATGKFHNTV